MAGEVTERQMRLLVAEGKHPSTGQHLGRIWRRFPATTEESRRAALDRALARLPADAIPEQRHQAWVKIMTAPERHAVAAFDVMVAPVKSVSLLWAFGDNTIKTTVMAAHHAGVRAVLRHLEKHAAFTRTGTDGIRQVDADGLAAMVFDHRMSRDHDPQLHSHIVISAKVRTTTDGTERWLALDGKALYQASIAARVAYERAVEGELARTLGVRFGVREGSDIREILGFSAASIRRYSKRRSSIEDEMRARTGGADGAGERLPDGRWRLRAQDASLKTRDSLKGAESTKDAATRWEREDRAARLGTGQQVQAILAGDVKDPITALAARAVRAAARQGPLTEDAVRATATADLEARNSRDRDLLEAVVDTAVRTEPRLAVARAVHDLGHERAVFGREHLELALGRVLDIDPTATTPTADWARVEALADTAMRTGQAGLRVLDPPALIAWEPSLRRASDGQSVYTRHRDLHLTTAAVLNAEQRVLSWALTGVATGAPTQVIDAVADTLQLTDDKRAALRFVAGDQRAAVAVHGPAGSGKTFLQAAVADLAHRTGVPILGLTVGQNAADLLAEATRDAAPPGGRTGERPGMRCENIAMWLHAQTRPPRGTTAADWAFAPGQWVVLDEASQASTHDLDRLIALLRPLGGKLILVGDPAQTGAIGPGGILTHLHTLGRAIQLTDLHRFTHPWEAAATLRLRDGDISVLADYDHRARIHGGHRAQLADQMLSGWAADTLTGQRALLLVDTEAEAAELAARAQQHLVRAGIVHAGPRVALRDGTGCGVGDTIVTRRNDRTNLTGDHGFVANRDQWTVIHLTPGGGLQVRNTRTSATTTLDPAYVARHVHLAYAQTVESAQGQTVDTCRALIDSDTPRSRLYVMLSRGSDTNHAYVVTHHRPDDAAPPPPAGTALAVLADILRVDDRDHTATATRQQLWNDADALHQWAPIFDDLAAATHAQHVLDLVAARTDAATAARLADDPALPAVLRTLARLADAGYRPDHALTAVISWRELDSADSVALVLDWRLQKLLDRAPINPTTVTPATYADRLPAGNDSQPGATLRTIAVLCDARIDALAHHAADHQPAWATPLGPVPDDPHGRAEWLDRAAAVAAYRDRYQPASTSTTDPIGLEPSPSDPTRWTIWHQARIALRTATLAGRAAAISTPELVQVINRAQQLLASAPPDASAQLRAAYLRLARAQTHAHQVHLDLAAATTRPSTPAPRWWIRHRRSVTARPDPTTGQRPPARRATDEPVRLHAVYEAAQERARRAATDAQHLERVQQGWLDWYIATLDERLAGAIATVELTRRASPHATPSHPRGSALNQLHTFAPFLDRYATSPRPDSTPRPSSSPDIPHATDVDLYDPRANDADGIGDELDLS